ncbi:MAG: hypothetical protein J6125_00580, partial [Clostridia bacterium]|nr:hypothetical protein [Clostridia bacterium]
CFERSKTHGHKWAKPKRTVGEGGFRVPAFSQTIVVIHMRGSAFFRHPRNGRAFGAVRGCAAEL